MSVRCQRIPILPRNDLGIEDDGVPLGHVLVRQPDLAEQRVRDDAHPLEHREDADGWNTARTLTACASWPAPFAESFADFFVSRIIFASSLSTSSITFPFPEQLMPQRRTWSSPSTATAPRSGGKFEAVSTRVKAQTGGTRVKAQTRLQPWVKVAPRPDIAEMYRQGADAEQVNSGGAFDRNESEALERERIASGNARLAEFNRRSEEERRRHIGEDEPEPWWRR